MPTGPSIDWIFSKFATVEELYDFILVKNTDQNMKRFRILTKFPRKPLLELKKQLHDLGIENTETLIVEKI